MKASLILAAAACLQGARAFVAPVGARAIARTSALRMVAAGEAAPDFSLKDTFGNTVTLSSFKGEKDVVLFFYPKDNTPGCTKQACTFNESLARFKKAGAEVIGISSDEDHTDFVNKYKLGMTMVSDIGGKVRKEYKVPGALFGALDGRVTYIIDKQGVVTKVHEALADTDSHVRVALEAVGA